jgi:hypothetical protein
VEHAAGVVMFPAILVPRFDLIDRFDTACRKREQALLWGFVSII